MGNWCHHRGKQQIVFAPLFNGEQVSVIRSVAKFPFAG
jgi:hypothetical protein